MDKKKYHVCHARDIRIPQFQYCMIMTQFSKRSRFHYGRVITESFYIGLVIMTFRHLNRICEAGFENTVELKLEMAGCLNTVEFEEMMAVRHYSVSTSLRLFFANDAILPRTGTARGDYIVYNSAGFSAVLHSVRYLSLDQSASRRTG